MKRYILILILFSAFALRFAGISHYPTGLTQDEAGIGYESYSLLKTGRDSWGKPWPLVLRSFGDYKMPLYSYLALPSVRLFGLNKFAVRLPSAVIGTLAVLTTYLMISEISKDKRLAVWSSLFLAVSPWHLSLSRGAFEANVSAFLVPLGVWSFFKGFKYPKWMTVSAFVFGINLFSYHSSRYFTFLLAAILIFLFRKEIIKNLPKKEKILSFIKIYKIPISVAIFMSLLAIYTNLTGGSERALDITIFNPTDNWVAVAYDRYQGITSGIPEQVARFFSNKLTYVYNVFVNNYLSYLSTTFFFTQGVSEQTYGMIRGRGVLYLFEVFLVISSAISFIRSRGFKNMIIIVFWIISAPLIAAFTKGPGFSGTRSAVMMPAIQILSAWGVIYLRKVFGKVKPSSVKIWEYGVGVMLVISVLIFLHDYILIAPISTAKDMSYGRNELVAKVSELENDYETIYVSRTLSVPHIWFLFYNRIEPELVQDASKNWLEYETAGYQYLDQFDGYKFGRYIFGNLFYEKRRNLKDTLFVGQPDEFPKNIKPLFTLRYPDNTPSYIIVESDR